MVKSPDRINHSRRPARHSKVCRGCSAGDCRGGGALRLPRKVPYHQRGPVGDARSAANAIRSHPALVAVLPRQQTVGRLDQPGDQRYRRHPELYRLRFAGRAGRQPDSGRHGGRHVLYQLALHADCAFRGARAFRRGVLVYAAH